MNLNKQLATTFVGRAAELGMKGKARDRAALEFMCGAYAALRLVAEESPDNARAEEYAQGAIGFAMIVSVRGFEFVQDVVSHP